MTSSSDRSAGTEKNKKPVNLKKDRLAKALRDNLLRRKAVGATTNPKNK